METQKLRNIVSCSDYGVQYIDVTNNPVFVGLESGFVNSPTIKLRRGIDLTNVCAKNNEEVMSGTEFTAAELEAILSKNAEENSKSIEPLEVSPINSKTEDSTTSNTIQFVLGESDLPENKRLIDLNTPVYLDVSDRDDGGIIIETDIAATVEVGTDYVLPSKDNITNLTQTERSNNYINDYNINSNETRQYFEEEPSKHIQNENNNELIPEEELKLIESLTNKYDNKKTHDFINNVTAYSQSKNYEILKAAKSLYSKRTRTLWHWIDPKIPKTKLKHTVLLAWDHLPAWQKQIYISQVLGKFSMDVVTPMVNPQLAGITVPSPPNTELTPLQNNIAKKRMYIHKPIPPKWDCCFKTKKKATNGISIQDSPT